MCCAVACLLATSCLPAALSSDTLAKVCSPQLPPLLSSTNPLLVNCSNTKISSTVHPQQAGICRQSEGSSPEGYTLQEACTLTRSSLPKQGVLALRILQAVLARARPKASHHDAHGTLQPQFISLPSELSETGGSKATLVCLLVVPSRLCLAFSVAVMHAFTAVL